MVIFRAIQRSKGQSSLRTCHE